MTNETETLTSGIDPASFSSVIKPTNDLFRYVNGPWIDTYRLPDDRSRYGSFDKLAEDAENQVRDILDADDCPAVKSEALYHSFLNTDAIEAAGLDPIRDELAEQYLQIDPHSPAEFRTNGIASNVDLFYDAFGVTEGDAMWLAPKDRVRIW